MGVFAFKLSNAASKSTRAKVLKLAEKTGNLRALAVSPPPIGPLTAGRVHRLGPGGGQRSARSEQWLKLNSTRRRHAQNGQLGQLSKVVNFVDGEGDPNSYVHVLF